MKVVVDELPKRSKDCVFYESYPNYRCTIGGKCSYHEDCTDKCDKLVELKELIKNGG